MNTKKNSISSVAALLDSDAAAETPSPSSNPPAPESCAAVLEPGPRALRHGGLMSSRNLARVLHEELERLAPRYASLSVEYAPLLAYPTLASLVGRLTDREKNKSRAAQRDRSELLSAIIGAYQQTHDRLWGAILVAAFRPMLATKRFYGADPDEREAIFFAALTEVVDKLDVRQRTDQVHAIVWLSAKKALVRKLRQHTAWSEVGFGDDADATPDATSWLPEPWLAAWLLSRGVGASRTRALRAPALCGAKERPDLDLVVSVEEWGSLKAYVEAAHAALPPAERSRVYGQLQKRHRRAVAQLREALAGAREQARPRTSHCHPERSEGSHTNRGLCGGLRAFGPQDDSGKRDDSGRSSRTLRPVALADEAVR